MSGGLNATLSVAFDHAGGRTRVRCNTEPPLDLRGPFSPPAGPEMYYLRNNSCGILSADNLNVHATAATGVNVQVASASATKIYASQQRSRSCSNLRVEAGSQVAWGPHPLILQQGADHCQDTTVHLQGGVIILSDVLVLGRLASDERNSFRRFESRLRVLSPASEALYEEHYLLEPAKGCALASSLGGMGALASVYLLGPVEVSASYISRISEAPFAGAGRLPNRAGYVARCLANSLSQALAFVDSALECLGA